MKKRAITLSWTVAAALVATPSFALEHYSVDKAHSRVAFTVRHLMGKVTGTFQDYDLEVAIDRDRPEASTATFTIQAASIDTGNPDRDKQLRTPDFFDVAKFPTLSFTSTKVAKGSADTYQVTGTLTMHGVSRTITLPVEYLGAMKDPRGNNRAGFAIATSLNRKDYGIIWNQVLDAGGTLLGEDVTIDISLETVQAKD